MLPNFLIIGAQKGATTWLARRLETHPAVFLAPEKELHFFNHRYDKGLGWYEARFKQWHGEVAVGEATPGYLNHPDAPARIRADLGAEVKLIVSLRHPVERAYSAYWHYVTRGDITPETDFQTIFQQDGTFGIRSRGYYYAHLSHYLTCFPRENLLVLIYEDWQGKREESLVQCLEFLGVHVQDSPLTTETKANASGDVKQFQKQLLGLRRRVVQQTHRMSPGVRQQVRKVGRYFLRDVILKQLPDKATYTPLDETIKAELLETYMADITQLESLLERKLTVWYEQKK